MRLSDNSPKVLLGWPGFQEVQGQNMAVAAWVDLESATQSAHLLDFIRLHMEIMQPLYSYMYTVYVQGFKCANDKASFFIGKKCFL